MGTHTEIIPNNEPVLLTWKDIHSAKFAFDTSFRLELGPNEFFYAEKMVRLVPRRRMIAFGQWQGKDVVAKMFFHVKRREHHAKKELKGVKALVDNKVPTPKLYRHGYTPDKCIYILIFERLQPTKSVDEIWRSKVNMDEVYPLLESLVLELATQHVVGVLQRDLHLKNFLVKDEVLYTIDTAEIDCHPPLLPKAMSMANLAGLLSQLGLDAAPYQETLFKYYAKARGWLLKPEDFIEFNLLIKKTFAKRWQRFQRKILRESTHCACIEDWRTFGMFERVEAHTEFLKFLRNPEAIFNHPTAQLLKNGRSSTVIKVTLDERELVVKRYNMKSVWHFLRRCLRPTRALTSWRLAQKLNLFGVATAKPLAFIEKKIFGLREKSYFVTEYVQGHHVGDFLRQAAAPDAVIEKVTALLKNTIQAEITHGDLKMSNILINQHEKPILIDLDGASEHVSMSSLRSAWRREIKRFLRNFNHQPSIKEKFERALGL